LGLASQHLLASVWQVVSHNWALVSIAATLVVLLVVPALVLAKYLRICLNIIRETHPPLSAPQWGYDRIPGENYDFYAGDGIRLRGVFMHPPPNVARRGTIIFAPEFKSDRHSCARYGRPLIDAGYDVFSLDFRGHGESMPEAGYFPRQWASDREVADMTGAISFVEQWLEEQGRPIELGLFGISRGACVGLLAAEQCASVKAIVTDGAFSSDCTLEHLMRRWAKIFAKVRIVYENHPPEFWRFLRWVLFLTCRVKFKCAFPSVRKTLGRMIPRPILFIHGERDSYIPVVQSRLLYALASQPKFLWVVREAKHNQSVDIAPREYARRTVQFFDHYLAKRYDPGNIYNEDRFVESALDELARRRLPHGGRIGDLSPDRLAGPTRDILADERADERAVAEAAEAASESAAE
jgi:pimeloyl-ACP methyl ester carboxylesterase